MLIVLILLNLIFITSTTGSWHQLDGIEYYETRLPYAFYIGLSRTSSTTLQWSDGTTTNTSVFTYWDGPDDIYDSRKLCVTMGFYECFSALFKWKIEKCSGKHRYICQRQTSTTTPATKTTRISTIRIFTNSYTLESTPAAIVNNANSSDTSVVTYAMIGVGAIVVLVICGIIYINYYRNNKPTTDDVNERNSGSEEDEGPVVVDNVLYGTSAEPTQDLYEEADKVDPVYSCADVSASYVVPNVEFHAEAAVYDCTPDNASTDNGCNETNDNSCEDPSKDIYAQVEKSKTKLKK